MAIIANAKVKTREEHWLGEVISGKHQLMTDKPESFGGQDLGVFKDIVESYLQSFLAACEEFKKLK